MKRTSLTPFLWLTALVGCSGLLSVTPQTVSGHTNSPVLLVQQSDELEELKRLVQQATQLYDQGKYSEAIPLVEKAVEIVENAVGSESPDLAKLVNVLGLLHYYQGNYSEAEPLIQRSLAIREKALGENHPDVATSLNNLASLYDSQGRYDEAEPLHHRSLDIREKVLGENHPDVASSLNSLALLYSEQGRFDEAEPLIQRSLLIRENALAENHPDIAQSLNNLAELYKEQGRYNEAEPLIQRSLAILEKALGENHPHVATTLNNLAGLYDDQGRYNEAESLYHRSLAIYEKALGENHPDIALSLNNLAQLYKTQGRYDEAEPLYQRSLAIFEKALGENHPDVAASLNNLALLYSEQGRYDQAEALYQRSLAIREKALGQNHPDVAASLNNLASLYDSQGRYDQAEALYQRSLAIWEKALGQNHPDVAINLNNLAGLYNDQGRYDQAEALYQRSLAIREKALGQNHPDVAINLNNLAGLYNNQGRYDQAEALYQRSLAIWEKALGQNHPLVATNLSNLALLYQIQGNTTQAINFLSRGLDVEEQNLNVLLATGSERQKQDSMKTVSNTTDIAVSLHLQNAPNNSEAEHLALTTLLRRKGRILDVVTNDLQLLRENLTPENQKFLDKLQTVRTELANLIYKQPENLSLEQYRQQVTTLRTKAEQLEAELSRRSSEFRAISKPVTIEAVQQLIPENAALVELVWYKPADVKANQWGKPHYAAYILKSSGEPQWIDLGEADAIHEAYFKRRGFGWNLVVKASFALMKKSARSLDELLMQPIRDKLGDVNHIIISPDAQLNKIPFAALVDENNQYLIENYQITYLTTGRDLIRLQNEYSHRQNPVILANPNYENPGQPTTVPVAKNSESPLNPPRMGDFTSSSPQIWGARGAISLNFQPLPGTAEEAKRISALLPNFTVFTEHEATENVVKQVEAPEILHIATHGFFLPKNPRSSTSIQENPLLRSGLAMAGFNPRESGSEDGVLTALEVANLKLRGTKLVVLSACETGLGDVENGEGVYGLRRAFTLAGAESQVMSLWKVNDEGTKELMIKYYQRLLQNQGRSEALRQTQLEMLNSQNYQHPYYWAAFVPVGEWTPMND